VIRELSGWIWLAGFVACVVWIYTVGPSTWVHVLSGIFAGGFLYRSIWPRRKS